VQAVAAHVHHLAGRGIAALVYFGGYGLVDRPETASARSRRSSTGVRAGSKTRVLSLAVFVVSAALFGGAVLCFAWCSSSCWRVLVFPERLLDVRRPEVQLAGEGC
jgi:hypothetical protein